MSPLDMVRKVLVRSSGADAEPSGTSFHPISEPRQLSALFSRSENVPVVIMTSSDDEKDILSAYNLYVNAYVTKPVDLDQFITVVKSIEHFWFSIVKLPAA